MEKKIDDIFRDTMEFVHYIVDDYDYYGDLIQSVKSGSSLMSFKQKQLVKKIDENWVLAIETALPALDAAVRTPTRFLEEKEQVMPIELSRNITARSIQHLSQHTNYISSIEDGNITPTKILNVYRDETLETYENKFLYTLIERLNVFIERRYAKLAEYGLDESRTAMAFETVFETEKNSAKMNFQIELHDKEQTGGADGKSVKFERVSRLRSTIGAFYQTELMQTLKGKMIRPPVMRTNAILKNKNMRTCLELWEFIESYDQIGYEIVINENAKEPNETYIEELYSLLALQYVAFQFHLEGGLEHRKPAVSEHAETNIAPRFITKMEEYETDTFNVYDVQQKKYINIAYGPGRKRLSAGEVQVREALKTALSADKEISRIRKNGTKRTAGR